MPSPSRKCHNSAISTTAGTPEKPPLLGDFRPIHRRRNTGGNNSGGGRGTGIEPSPPKPNHMRPPNRPSLWKQTRFWTRSAPQLGACGVQWPPKHPPGWPCGPLCALKRTHLTGNLAADCAGRPFTLNLCLLLAAIIVRFAPCGSLQRLLFFCYEMHRQFISICYGTFS
jgi:hypothetical protein